MYNVRMTFANGTEYEMVAESYGQLAMVLEFTPSRISLEIELVNK